LLIAATIGGVMVSRIYLVNTAVLLAIVGLNACATEPPRQTYWINPGFGQELQQQRFTLDSTECAALANQMIPEPSPPPQPQTGNITLNTPNGPVFGSYQTQPPAPQGYQPTGFLAGWQRGEREQNRGNYAVVCMANRGWQQRERIVGQQPSPAVGQGDCKVFPVPMGGSNTSIVTPYNGGCKGGLANGQGSYTFSGTNNDGTVVGNVKGEFREGKLNGDVTITMTQPDRVLEGEFRENRTWNTIVRGVGKDSVRYAVQVRDGVNIATCRSDGNFERNCTDRDRLLGTR
jgi:hypothetical protein